MHWDDTLTDSLFYQVLRHFEKYLRTLLTGILGYVLGSIKIHTCRITHNICMAIYIYFSTKDLPDNIQSTHCLKKKKT